MHFNVQQPNLIQTIAFDRCTKEQTDNVKSVISHTEIEDNDFQQKYYPIFIEHMKTLDKIRNTKLELIIPTLI